MAGEPPRRDPADSLWRADRRALTIGLVLTITLIGFEALAISTVMPIVADELGGIELYGWVFSAFFLGSLIGIVVVGGAIDRGGLAVPFAAGLGLFAIGLLAGGLAPSMLILVVARFVQGLGAGALQPIAYVAIGRIAAGHAPAADVRHAVDGVDPARRHRSGDRRRGRRDRSAGGSSSSACCRSSRVAGALTLGALRDVAVPPGVDEARAAAASRSRLPLAIAVAVGAGLLTVGLTSGQPLPTVALSVGGVVIGILALRRLTPPGTLLARPILPAAVLLRGILTCAFFGVDAFVALTLVDWRGLSATEAGLALTAATISWTAGSWTQARGAARRPTYQFVRIGFAITTIGLAGMLLVLNPEVPWLFGVLTFGVAGLGMGLSYSPLALIVLRESTPETPGRRDELAVADRFARDGASGPG